MKKLKVYLQRVEKVNNKIQNVVSYVIRDERDIPQRLSLHDGNVKKYEVANMK
jgi:hypothetical protein